MEIINVKNLTKRYDKFTAVNNISFAVKSGETFGILGPNGAGKTTTLEMIETLRSITKGSITVDKFDVTKQPDEVKRVIGVQLQSSSYFERLNLAELINLFASLYKVKVDPINILKEVGLESKATQYVNKLSGGQQQRFSIASTLVNNPKIVFLDEPTTGLDPQARRNIWELIQQIRAKGQTIVITTHYMEEAEYLCDRIAIMDQGKIIALDTPAGLIKNYGSGSVISFKTSSKAKTEQFAKLPGVKSVTKDKQTFKLATDKEMETLQELLKYDQANKFIDLTIRQSTLEDVFLNLTGKKLRE